MITAIERRPRIFNVLHMLRLAAGVSDTSETELKCLERYAAGKNSAAEIGTFMGVSAVRIARAIAPNGHLCCIDPYGAISNPNYQIAVRSLVRAGVRNKVTFIDGTTSNSAHLIPEKLDFIFVDGDHSRKGISADWRLVVDRLQIGGVACFHDTAMHPGRTHHESLEFFRDSIAVMDGFHVIETCETLSVVSRTKSRPT
jgi:predicted O-methyltransferase YrrM